MKKGKKIALLLAALCIVAGAALVFAVLKANDFDWEKLSTVQYVKKELTISEPFTDVVIENGAADVQIIPTTNGRCTIEYSEADGISVDAQVQNGILTIHFADTRSPLGMIGFSSTSPYLWLSLPQAQYSMLSVHGSSGDVMVPYKIGFGTVSLETVSGDVFFSDNAETLTVGTHAGDVHLQNNAVQSLRVSTSSGMCSLTDVTARNTMHLQTASGDVTLQNCDAASLEIRTGSGDVTGTLRTGKVYDVQTGSGDVRVPQNANGGTCTVRTGSGDVLFS